MRFIYCLILISLLIMWSHPTFGHAQSQSADTEAIIIEVEGDPNKHQSYIQKHHPFVEVVQTFNMLFNGLALKGEPEKLAKLTSLDFIKAIHPVRTYKALAHDESIDLSSFVSEPDVAPLTLPAMLNKTPYTGKGVKVGVIDTGIDYNHPDLVANYRGGYDLVDLDDDPMETDATQGMPTIHGTHVSGIIAANGEMKGIAPDADIYAYRALGPGGSGSSVQVIAALERAVQDDVDIINLSLGNAVNGPDYPTSIAVNRAIDRGVAVVIANGNDGPDDWSVGSPATSPKAFAVGATQMPQRIPYLYAPKHDRQISLTPMLGAEPWDLEKDYPIAECTGEEEAVVGKIALLQRGDTPFHTLAKQAENNGAVAALIVNNEDESFQGSVEHESDPVTIPVASISKADGKWLLENMADEPTILETAYHTKDTTIAEFSSRGPVTMNWDIKPDITAPGSDIVSTVPGGYQALQGTSMAAPHVAGAIALLKEARPDWTNEQIVGALKTTAQLLKNEEGDLLEPITQGMGTIRPAKAVHTNTIIHNPLLSYGKIDSYRQTKTIDITIENTTNTPQTYTFDVPKKTPGLSWHLPQSFTLKAKERKTVPLALAITTQPLDKGIHQGWLTLRDDRNTYRLPYLFINKAADYPKAMGLEFSLKPLADDTYVYQFYLTESVKRIDVHLYDADTLIYDRSLLHFKDVASGMHEGELPKADIGEPGIYKALITLELDDGTYASEESIIHIE
ncbi:MAG TPA: S8 family serine peptidase [Bacillota bacterium]|nr:S8 family serine peptidase [Bacillota bacterium]